ncbi:MAG TPA: arginine--tRNA ligase [Candidatus Kapabacteria bacterium]|nr:arginine--tRNA ligase [Candidatus Kapabacteria bacterium]
MLYKRLEEQLRNAVAQVLPDADLNTVQVRPCPDPKFGDYQSNSLMALAKERKKNPRQLATDVLSKLDVSSLAAPVEIAGPGFLNFRAKPEALTVLLSEAREGKPLFDQPAPQPRTIVVDFSSPNVAKAMHVGHIRSTILGDAISRILRLLGHKVVTDNHIGDWGTQFGKLLVGWKRELNEQALAADPLGEMERIYKKVNAEFEQNEEIAAQARQELVKLQKGDAENNAIWKRMIELSLREFDKIYARMGVSFDHVLGESYYNSALAGVVQRLRDVGLAQESEGATVVFFEDIPELKEQPAIIQKSDGGANYTTTDLATINYRIETWKPDEIVYVTDARQQLHFKQLFAIFRRWMPAIKVRLSHVWFGMILGPDNKPFKTRTGENIKLTDLLNEAEERALAVVTEKNPELPESDRKEIARIVGLGAIKYSDLAPNRQSDYVFSWEKMLALNGNTAPYLQYAYTRVRSIFRKAEETVTAKLEPVFALKEADELTLAKHLMNFGLVLEAVAEDHRPNYLCTYLYELAGHFARFYENCPVLKAEPQDKADRLALCELTGRVLKQGLTVLGIETTERM